MRYNPRLPIRLRDCRRGAFLGWGPFGGFGQADEGVFQHVVDGGHRDDGHAALDVVGDVLEIFDILLRDQHGGQAPAQGGQQLLLEAADSEHAAA